jgi:hypothetical protein
MIAKPLLRAAAALFAAAGLAAGAASAATINFTFANAPGTGFFDPTPAAPVPGNSGTTIGAQRQILFQQIGQIWASRLNSDVPIEVVAAFLPLSCSATGAVLGSAGTLQIFKDFPGARLPNTWYHSALANKLAGTDLSPPTNPPSLADFDLLARFNANLGAANCLPGVTFYYGLDNKPGPNQIDLAAVLLHELGHGLGFSTFSDGDGTFIDGSPSVWDYFLFDLTLGKTWATMSVDERLFSQTNPRRLAWVGGKARDAVEKVLAVGMPEAFVLAGGFRGYLVVGPAEYGPPLPPDALVGLITDTAGNGCAAFAPNALRNRVALINRGACPFVQKVKNAQNAGAKAVIIVDNVPGGPPPNLGGSDPTITIPSVRISLEDGTALRAALPTAPIAVALLRTNTDLYTGATFADAPLLYTPNPYQPGSSVSHFDTSAKTKTGGDLLMEPFVTGKQALSVQPPDDLTYPLFRDIGW